jgi:hypothetical protein
MYKADVIKAGFAGLVGIMPSDNPSVVTVATDLHESQSGLYYNEDGHPLVTLSNILSIAPDFENYTYPAWTNAQGYSMGRIVSHNNQTWEAIRTVAADVEPGTSADDWKLYDAYSVWLRKRIAQAAINVINDWQDEKRLLKKGKSILDNNILYTGAGRISATINNQDKLAGLSVKPTAELGVLTRLKRFSCQFDKPVTFELRIYHTSQADPIQRINVEYTKQNGGVQWFDLNLDLKYFDPDLDAGGIYSLVYDQATIEAAGAKAINRVVDWFNAPCTTCNNEDTRLYRTRQKYIEVYPIVVEREENELLTDVDNQQILNDRNNGLNLEYSIYCDYTDYLIAQKGVFDQAILKRFSIDMLERFINNPEAKISRNKVVFDRARITYDLDGVENDKDNSLRKKYTDIIKGIDFATEGINRVCLACRKGTFRVRSV